MGDRAWAVARRIGLRNIGYLLLMLVLGVLAAAGMRVALLGGLVSLIFLVANLATLARAMGRRLPTLPSAIGVGLALVCGAALMEVAMQRAGV